MLNVYKMLLHVILTGEVTDLSNRFMCAWCVCVSVHVCEAFLAQVWLLPWAASRFAHTYCIGCWAHDYNAALWIIQSGISTDTSVVYDRAPVLEPLWCNEQGEC